jgi:peroxiredoxin 2/4
MDEKDVVVAHTIEDFPRSEKINPLHKMDNQCHNEIVPMPRIGEKAPSFTAVSTQGEIRFPEQYAGDWVIFFSHPADFTPVCTSEFMTFATMEAQFAQAGCKLVGLSVDGLFSHIAWLRTIKEKIEYKGMKNVEVKFPLIEDVSMDVAKKYGMIQPGESSTKAVRAVFIIDPRGIIRAMIYYPLSTGRNFDELYRALVAIQTADAFAVATPADWRPGEPVIVPPPGSCGLAKERMENLEGITCHDWFFCTKPISKEDIFAKIHGKK